MWQRDAPRRWTFAALRAARHAHRSARRTALLLAASGGVARAQTPTATTPPLAAQLIVGTVDALAGTDVEVPVVLDPGGQSVFTVRNDIETDAITPVRRLSPGGPPDCTANPRLRLHQRHVHLSEPACLLRMRAILQRTGNMPLPPGLLYTCTFLVDPRRPCGPYRSQALSVVAQNRRA